MLNFSVSHALIDHLSAKYDTHVIYPDDPIRETIQFAIDGLARLNPVLRNIADKLAVRTQRTSVTLPAPGKTLVILSPAAGANPDTLAETGAHEHQHRVQFMDAGNVQAIVDYANPELRAKLEADAEAVSLAVQWFHTGKLPSIADSMASLKGETYLLTPKETRLAEGILRSHLATMEAGLCPPITVAVEVLAWFRAHHPHLVLAEVA
jgi:hypothetical protein